MFDSVYAGKALYHFVKHVVPAHPELFLPAQKVLFIHTGGVFGLFDKASQILSIMSDGKPGGGSELRPPESSVSIKKLLDFIH